jgi:uncharacterized protein YndB with AHSA1/START domain
MIESNTDRIHKEITLRAPRSRVWRALTESPEFGEWFGVRLEGPFQVGEKIQGQITHPGYEHLTFQAWVERMDPEQSFTFRWQPHAIDPEVDYSSDPTTLVEFYLAESDGGTLLTVTESGFDALPKEHRSDAFIRNEGGWAAQVENIKRYVDG